MAIMEHPNIVKLLKTFEGSFVVIQIVIGIFLSWNTAIWVVFMALFRNYHKEHFLWPTQYMFLNNCSKDWNRYTPKILSIAISS